MTRVTPCGPIAGVPARAPGVTAYKGIRYAEAGRWEYPKQVTHWEDVYQADRFGPCAIQNSTFVPEDKSGRDPFYYHEFREGLAYTYSEDCQYLNIWAPDNAEKAPVIVYIHGGAFLSGSGWDKVFDEPVWPRKGVIGVTLNYRLGLFGYACLPELADEAGHTGNYGLYDQLCALQWVHDNIAAFGGDPDNITVMGQSAGAHSVQMLCSTKAAQGLIAKAVMSSGAGDDSVLFAGDWVMEHKYPFWTAWKEAAGASTLAELRALPPQALLGALGKQFAAQGFKVPKLAFYTNSHSEQTVNNIYKAFYESGKYADLWYLMEGKPMLVTNKEEFLDDLVFGLRQVYFVCIPLAAFVIFFRTEIISFLFFGGNFNESNLQATCFATLF